MVFPVEGRNEMEQRQSLVLMRHGPKNDNPQAHGTGIEALLAKGASSVIAKRAAESKSNTSALERLVIQSTPADRAVATAQIFHRVWHRDPSLRTRLTPPRINEFIGSVGISPLGKPVNLWPAQMSSIWAAAKKGVAGERETASLRACLLRGWTCSYRGSGISLHETACRIGTFAYCAFEASASFYHVAVGHSGDLEPFAILCWLMAQGRQAGDACDIGRMLSEVCPALAPLEEILLEKRADTGELAIKTPVLEFVVPLQVLRAQAHWFVRHGISQKVLTKKLGLLHAEESRRSPALADFGVVPTQQFPPQIKLQFKS
jgi:hypothetical protein